MLLEFRVRHYKSIKELETLSMLPSKLSKDNVLGILTSGKYNALPLAAMFGRNGAGKSNILDAIYRLQALVIRGTHAEEGMSIQHDYYKLDPEYEKMPTFFGIDFIASDGFRYTYEVEFDEKQICSENLNFYPKGQKAKLFERQFNEISFGDSFMGAKSAIEKLLYKNQLLLSKVRGENIDALKIPHNYIINKIFYRKPGELSNNGYLNHFAKNIYESKYPNYRENLARLLRASDTGIRDLEAGKRDLEAIQLPETIDPSIREDIKKTLEYYITTKHSDEDENSDKLVDFSIFDESMGTRRLLEIGGLMIESLHDGQLLIIDEFDISLHPILTKALVKLYNDPKTNPNNAQLIISTQDVTLLDSDTFSYDQLWIAEKTFEGWSNYYCLADIKGLRKNIPLHKWYIDGRLGGVPIINYTELQFEIS
jgi:AAA15 family ATPase/GTPase